MDMAGHRPAERLYLLLFFLAISYGASSRSFTSGRKFISVFLQNYDTTANLSLHIISYDKPANVTVSVSVPRYYQPVFVNANSTSLLTLNSSYMLLGNEISKKAITVISTEDISLVILNGRSKTYDSFLNIPFDNLGTKYYVVTYVVNSPYNIKQFAIANSNENVEVTITVSGSLLFNGTQYFDKEMFSFEMEPNQSIQFQSDKDLTGTKIESTRPVAVFSGDQCITVPPGNCDHIAEQLYPVDKWSDMFIIFPLIKKFKEDIITIVSAYNGTTIDIYTDERNWYEVLEEASHFNFSVAGGTIINSSKPIMVTYLSTGGSTSMVSTFDPFLVNVIPTAYFSNYYAFVTIENLYNYIVVISSGTRPFDIILDGRPLSDYQLENSNYSHFTATRVYLGEAGGRHVIYHTSVLFAIYVYGIGRAESYGYPMGNKELSTSGFQSITIQDEELNGVLTCLSQAAIFTLPAWTLKNADLSITDVHLIDSSCHANQKDENWIVIRVPFNGCGTTIINNTGKMVYVNTVYGTAPHTPVHRLIIKLMCEMSTEENITMGFIPHSSHMSRLGHYNVSFTLYHSAAFSHPIFKFPYETPLNGTLYLQVEAATNDSGVQILTESCISAPTLSPTNLQYSIIENGCPKDSTFQYFPSSDSRKQRFSFHAFKFDGYPQVFIICDVVLCHRTKSPNRCSQGCLSSRPKRDLNVGIKSSRLAQGPMVFPNNIEGRLQPSPNSERSGKNYYVPVVGVLSVGCAISILALVLQRKYYLQQSLRDTAFK